MATVTFDKATRLYPGTKPAVDKLNLEIADGEFLVLVGPSGCGKSTSLRMLAGLEDVNARPHPHRRPRRHPPAAEGPRHRDGVPELRALPAHDASPTTWASRSRSPASTKDEIRKRVEEAAKILDLEPYLDRKPKALSGGQRQRVAMGRAIVRKPAGVPHGRAAVEPRRQAARADPHPDRLAAAPARRHHRLRHPRPGRGHDDGRPGRGAQGRPAPAGRHPARAVRPPEQRLRRRLHRLAPR